MEGFVDNAKKFLGSEQGKNVEQQIKDKTGFDVNQYLGDNNNASSNQQQNTGESTDAFGNKGQEGQYAQPGQYGAVTGAGFGGGLSNNNAAAGQDGQAQGGQGQPGQFGEPGQYGAVTGKGFGGDMAKDRDGQPLQGQGGQGKSAYEGYDQYDSTASGGYGRNAAGHAFSRQNQMGTDNQPEAYLDDDEAGHGYKTGTSTPGYRQEGDVDAEAAENRMRNQNMNVYGKQDDDRGSSGNDLHEANN